jgi:DNA-binding response OmpR family regulator
MDRLAELFRTERPLAVVLDLILPRISGRELCQTFKSISSETPVIVLSAISEVVDKVLLLELGLTTTSRNRLAHVS